MYDTPEASSDSEGDTINNHYITILTGSGSILNPRSDTQKSHKVHGDNWVRTCNITSVDSELNKIHHNLK